MMSRSAPPFSMNLALMPVPAPAAMMGCPLRNVARNLSMTSLRLYGFPLPVHGFGIWPMTLAGSLADRNDLPFGTPRLTQNASPTPKSKACSFIFPVYNGVYG